MFSQRDFTTDPIEAEVHAAVARYKIALIRTGHQSFWHRVMCWIGDQDALTRASSLLQAEHHTKKVLGKSPAHRVVLEQIVRNQPGVVAKKDNLLSLLSENSLVKKGILRT